MFKEKFEAYHKPKSRISHKKALPIPKPLENFQLEVTLSEDGNEKSDLEFLAKALKSTELRLLN